MKKIILNLIISLLILTMSWACSTSNGKKADDNTKVQVTAVIDSLVALEPEMSITSLSVVKAPIPSVMADEVQPALKQSAEMVAAFIFARAFGGKSSSDDSKMAESFIAMGAPLREAMKKYESEDHPDYVFGLVKLENPKDSSKNERRIYIFDKDNLNSVARTEKFSKKKNQDVAMLFALAFGDQIDLNKKDIKPEDIKAINDNPILKFIVDDK